MKISALGRGLFTSGIAGVILLSLGACQSAPGTSGLVDSEWQISNLYLKAGEPSTLPPRISAQASVVFGKNTITGSTGCSQIQAMAELSADTIEIKDLQLDPADGSPCSGHDLAAHQSIIDILQSGRLEILRPSDSELVLREDTGQPDPPAIRLVLPGAAEKLES